MILEAVILHIKLGGEQDFEAVFREASNIISSQNGYLSHELQRCIEAEGKYLLLVRWENLADHIIGFRESSDYQKWKQLLHYFYGLFPIVEHFEAVLINKNE